MISHLSEPRSAILREAAVFILKYFCWLILIIFWYFEKLNFPWAFIICWALFSANLVLVVIICMDTMIWLHCSVWRDQMARCFAVCCSALGLRCCARRDRMVRCFATRCSWFGPGCCTWRDRMVRCFAIRCSGLGLPVMWNRKFNNGDDWPRPSKVEFWGAGQASFSFDQEKCLSPSRSVWTVQ